MDHNQISHLIRHYEDQKFTSYHVDHQSLYLTSYTEPIIETRELKNTELLCTWKPMLYYLLDNATRNATGSYYPTMFY